MNEKLETMTVQLKKPSPVADFLRRLIREKPLGAFCGFIILFIFLIAVFADFIIPYGIHQAHFDAIPEGPSARFWLGTDEIGADVLSRIIWGARVTILVGLITTMLHVIVALFIGVPTGFFGGKLDLTVQRFVDAWMAFPSLLIIITFMALLGRGSLQLVLVLGISIGIVNSRVIRSAVIAIKANEYVVAARAIGNSHFRILLRHILPNIFATVIVLFTITIGNVIIAEAGLSFLGYGLSHGTPSWGGMLNWEGRQYMESNPGLAFWPGLSLMITVFSINMFGDALRDLLDPRLRGGQGSFGAAKKRKRGFFARFFGKK